MRGARPQHLPGPPKPVLNPVRNPGLRRLQPVLPSLLLLAALGACGDAAGPATPTSPTSPGPAEASAPQPVARSVPASMMGCQQCHARVVAEFLGHGMSDTLAPLDAPGDQRRPPMAALTQAADGVQYSFSARGDEVLLTALRPDGGLRRQRVVGRIGAGVHDVSWVGTELDPDGRDTDRLAFLPLELLTGHGLDWAPFMHVSPHTGFDLPVNAECLGCHSTADPSALPGAARVTAPAPGQAIRVWPGDQLGADALQHLPGLDCAACHGDAGEHERRMRARLDGHAADAADAADAGAHDGLGLTRLGSLPAPRQRDVCARCHLQGEAELDLSGVGGAGRVARGGPQPDPLAAYRPVLVPAVPGDDFRFVSQSQRLVLSACFAGAPELTCTGCHRPHAGVAAQGPAAFDARCLGCHGAERACVRPPGLQVHDVTGDEARSPDGCVDCHMRRSQPFDLPHLRTADHWVRRHIPPPATAPMRAWDPAAGRLQPFDDGRLAARLQDEDGRRWAGGLEALALARMGRTSDAAVLFMRFAAPGSPAARVPTAPPGLPALETAPEFHHQRALLLESVGDLEGATRAYGDALALDPTHPQARLNRATLRRQAGDMQGALHDATELLRLYPAADKPWNLLAQAAASAGDLPGAAAALTESAVRWPSSPAVWHELGRLALTLQAYPEARAALDQAARLEPSRPGLADDIARAAAAR